MGIREERAVGVGADGRDKMVVPVPQLILNRIWEGIASVIGNKLPLN